METIVYRVKFEDGREYRVFCANKAQKQRMYDAINWYEHISMTTLKVTEIINGVHNVKQWEDIVNNL